MRLPRARLRLMPAARARYDVTLSDGVASWNTCRPSTRALLDFMEEREPDDWGDPGRLIDARLDRVLWVSQGRPDAIGYRRPRLLLNGSPVRASARHRRFLRWHLPEDDPPPHDDPDCIIPP